MIQDFLCIACLTEIEIGRTFLRQKMKRQQKIQTTNVPFLPVLGGGAILPSSLFFFFSPRASLISGCVDLLPPKEEIVSWLKAAG